MKSQLNGLLKPVLNLTAVALMLTALVGCYEETNTMNSTTTYDVEAIVSDNELNSVQKAEEIARIGEKLLTPSGFMYADEAFDLALTFDKLNARAQLYKKINAPVMALQGSLARLQPVINKFSPQVRQDFLQARRNFALNKQLDAFFNVGPADIKTEAQAQALVDRVLNRQDELRLFIKANKNSSMELYPVLPVGELLDVWTRCPVTAGQTSGKHHKTYTVKNCHFQHDTKFAVNMGDLEVLQQIAAGMQIYMIVGTSYDISGGSVVQNRLSVPNSLSIPQRIALWKSQATLGRVRNASAFRMIKDLGSDIYGGARWAQQFQNRLCPKGWEAENQRPGMLFDKGICVQDYPGQKRGHIDAAFHVVAAALAGQTVSVFTHEGSVDVTEMADSTSGMDYETQANLLAPIVNPIADLKSLLPTKFDKCGQSTNLGDVTVGGLLPRGDGEKVAKNIGLISDECK